MPAAISLARLFVNRTGLRAARKPVTTSDNGGRFDPGSVIVYGAAGGE